MVANERMNITIKSSKRVKPSLLFTRLPHGCRDKQQANNFYASDTMPANQMRPAKSDLNVHCNSVFRRAAKEKWPFTRRVDLSDMLKESYGVLFQLPNPIFDPMGRIQWQIGM